MTEGCGVSYKTQNVYGVSLSFHINKYVYTEDLYKVFRCFLTGDWMKLHNEELHNLYSLPNIIRMMKSRRMRWAGHVARMGETGNAYRLLVGKPEGKRPLGRQRCKWVGNIKMDI
jgi:hypothetical protein